MTLINPVFRLGPTRHYKGYASYEEAARWSRCDVNHPEVHVDTGKGGEIAVLPPEPFTMHLRTGDVVRMVHVVNGEVRPGHGRGDRRRRPDPQLPATAPWVYVNMNERTVRYVHPVEEESAA
jgi:hypothetical protein